MNITSLDHLVLTVVDIDIIAKGVSLDKRIGKYGTITGKAFGGKCLPKDIKAFISFSQKYINHRRCRFYRLHIS